MYRRIDPEALLLQNGKLLHRAREAGLYARGLLSPTQMSLAWS